MNAKVFLTALSVAMASTVASYVGEEVEIPWADVPAAVQKTVTDNAGGGKIGKIEKETKGGKIVYEAKVQKPDGTKLEINVGEDGKLIEDDDD